MKRSNILFISLFAILFIIPFITMGVFYFFPSKHFITGFDQQFKVAVINNPSLQAKNVEVNNEVTPSSIRVRIKSRNILDGQSFIFYEGSDSYLPTISHMNDTLYIGKPTNNHQDNNLTLKIRIESLEKVFLNNEVIWNKTPIHPDDAGI